MDTSLPEWHHYLQQAFAAATPEQRVPLYHLGIVPERLNGHWYTGATLHGYPALRAGLRRGDRLLTIDGQTFHPVQSLNANGHHPRGLAYPQPISLTFERNGAQSATEVLPVYENLYDSYRSAIDASINRFITGNKAVTYTHLWALSRSPADLHYYRHLFNTVFRGSDALILDLRHAYGYVDWQHTDPFFASRRAFPTWPGRGEDRGEDAQQWITPPPGDPTDQVRRFEGPVVIICNEHTRGGAEELMYRLATSPRVMLVGVGTENVAVDFEQRHPVLSAGSVDAQFEAALNVLLNVL